MEYILEAERDREREREGDADAMELITRWRRVGLGCSLSQVKLHWRRFPSHSTCRDVQTAVVFSEVRYVSQITYGRRRRCRMIVLRS